VHFGATNIAAVCVELSSEFAFAVSVQLLLSQLPVQWLPLALLLLLYVLFQQQGC